MLEDGREEEDEDEKLGKCNMLKMNVRGGNDKKFHQGKMRTGRNYHVDFEKKKLPSNVWCRYEKRKRKNLRRAKNGKLFVLSSCHLRS